MKRSTLLIALLASSSLANAAPWIYRGTLNDGGKPANGHYDLRLTLVNSTGTAQISQPVTLNGVAVTDGNFTAEVDFGFDLTKAPAMKLKTEVQQDGSGFASLGEPSAFDANAALAGICWDTTGNVVAAGEFLGSTNNVPLVLKASNVDVLRMTGGLPGATANIVAGSNSNTVSSGSRGQTVAGGGDGFFPNSTAANFATVSGGTQNSASGASSTVSGGASNVASGEFSIVSGGFQNAASGARSNVGGGASNVASAPLATIAGGEFNTASGSLSAISGGTGNVAALDWAYVGGGFQNQALGQGSFVGGGFSNLATADGAVVDGGVGNCAGGNYSWAGGAGAKIRPGNLVGASTCAANSGDADGDNGTFVWSDNRGTNFTSTGPNQFLVRTLGGMAINTNTPTVGAALTVTGGNVSIPNPGTLNFGSTTRQMVNLFQESPTNYGIGVQTATLYNRVSAVGGFAWFQGGTHNDAQNNPGTGGTLRMTLDAAGQLRTTTGTIATFSDARLKKNVSDYSGALAQVSALRPVNYEYREPGKSFQMPGRHIGFIAQEVREVFPQWVAEDDEGHLMLSLRGFEAVAVRAIQELDANTTSELLALKSENAQLRARLAAIEARLGGR